MGLKKLERAGEWALRRFRKGGPSDAPALCEVRELAIMAAGAGTHTRRQLEAWARSRDLASCASALAGDQEVFCVATEDDDRGRISGFASLSIEGRPHLWSLYVHPWHQGRGIGRGLLGAVEAECRVLGLEELNVAAFPTSAGFYDAMDYRLVCEFSTGLPLGGGEA